MLTRSTPCLLSLAAAALALAGCPSPAPPADAAVDAAPVDACAPISPGNTGLTARFALAPGVPVPPPGDIPFPSDVYRDADGTLRDDIENFAALRLSHSTRTFTQGFSRLDGFGLNTGALFVIDSDIATNCDAPFHVDPASLPADGPASLLPGATAFIVDLDPSATAATARVPSAAGWHRQYRVLTVQPEHTVLRDGRRYAVVLTTGVRATALPTVLRAAPSFAAIRDNAPGARSGPVGQLYGTAIDRVVELMGTGFERASIASLAVFTTQTTHAQLRIARDAAVAARFTPPPQLVTDASVAPFTAVRFGASAHAGWTATLTEWLGTAPTRGGMDVPGFPDETDPPGTGLAHDAIGAVLSGVFVSPDFRPADGTMVWGADGLPIVANAAQRLPVTIVLPRGPVPPAGFPVVIFGHGLGGQRREMLSIANEMARAGIATAAIDHATFGQRADPTDTRSLERGTYRGPDGLGDSPNYPTIDFFGTLSNITAFRDNVRQSVLDLVQLRRLLANPALDLATVAMEYGGTAPRLDGAHIAYVGNSLGGIIGTVFAATEPEANPVVLNVAGGGLVTQLSAHSPAMGALLTAAARTIFVAPSGAPADRFNPLGNLLQMIVDGADPAVYAADITRPAAGRPRDVWLVEALQDEVVSNEGTELLAYQMGLPQIEPVLEPLVGLATATAPVSGNLPMGATGAYLQMAPSTHGANLSLRRGRHSYEPPFPRATGERYPMLARPYLVRESIVALQRNIARFLTTGFAGSAQISIEGMVPLMDLDDDGWTDAEERAAATDPNDPESRPPGTAPHTREVGF